MKEELKMTTVTVSKLLGEKKVLSKLNRDLRFQLMTLKKQILTSKTTFVIQKTRLKSKIVQLKKQNNELKNNLNTFMFDDDDFISDPETGVVDMTQPQTPEKPKRVCLESQFKKE